MVKKKQFKLGPDEHKEEKWQEAIKVLNDTVSVKLAPSSVHGVGVFALRDFKEGEKLYLNVIPNMYDVPYRKFNKLKPYIREILLGHFPYKARDEEQSEDEKKKDGNAYVFWYPVNNMQAYLNHADQPNYDAFKDVALKDIKIGEEITEDYRQIKGYELIFDWLLKK